MVAVNFKGRRVLHKVTQVDLDPKRAVALHLVGEVRNLARQKRPQPLLLPCSLGADL